MFINTIFDK